MIPLCVVHKFFLFLNSVFCLKWTFNQFLVFCSSSLGALVHMLLTCLLIGCLSFLPPTVTFLGFLILLWILYPHYLSPARKTPPQKCCPKEMPLQDWHSTFHWFHTVSSHLAPNRPENLRKEFFRIYIRVAHSYSRSQSRWTQWPWPLVPQRMNSTFLSPFLLQHVHEGQSEQGFIWVIYLKADVYDKKTFSIPWLFKMSPTSITSESHKETLYAS